MPSPSELNYPVNSQNTPPPPSVDADVKDWTIMVYMAGDNNLSEHMAYSLESLGRFAASMTDEQRSRINVLAYFDGASITAPTMYADLSDMTAKTLGSRQPVTPELRIHKDEKAAGRSGPQDNSGSPAALLNFVRWCTGSTRDGLRGRTARNYALIVSGHSLGFHGTTFLHDEGTGQHFTLSQFRETLERANSLYLGGNISILGFDSCLMSMAEVGYELRDVASTIVASQGSVPNTGWGYAEMLGAFATRLEAGGDEEVLAASLVESFTALHRSLAVGGRSIDISAWRLGRSEEISTAVNRLASELNCLISPGKGENSAESARILKRIILQSHYDSQTYMSEQCVDLKDLCQRLIDECSYGEATARFGPVVDAANEAIKAVDLSVIRCGFSGESYQFSNGISIFFPWSSLSFAVTDSQYRALRFVSGSPNSPVADWYSFLLEYVGNVTLRRSRRSIQTAPRALAYEVPMRTPEPALAGASRDFLPLAKDFLPLAKDFLPLAKDFLPLAKDFLPLAKDFLPLAKDFLPLAKDVLPSTKDFLPLAKGSLASAEPGTCNYMSHFAMFKNYEIGWDISGFAEK